mmetsp:Transcript_95170/g.268939  ORF Transcript_95170/g.268939 Transcript_95170/m.268939 type:complete len:232 (+) Transcript_95170:430-1125(+)
MSKCSPPASQVGAQTTPGRRDSCSRTRYAAFLSSPSRIAGTPHGACGRSAGAAKTPPSFPVVASRLASWERSARCRGRDASSSARRQGSSRSNPRTSRAFRGSGSRPQGPSSPNQCRGSKQWNPILSPAFGGAGRSRRRSRSTRRSSRTSSAAGSDTSSETLAACCHVCPGWQWELPGRPHPHRPRQIPAPRRHRPVAAKARCCPSMRRALAPARPLPPGPAAPLRAGATS